MSAQSQYRTGRHAQKARTRAAIVAAAKERQLPTVEAAADAAGVSRATAYRYFPTQASLQIELDRDIYWRDLDATIDDMEELDVSDRLNKLIDVIVATVTRDERHVRQALAVYHQNWLRNPDIPTRRGGRMEWIDAVLQPLSPGIRSRLRVPLALAVGPDQVTMLQDVLGLNAAEIATALKWSAAAMLKAASVDE